MATVIQGDLTGKGLTIGIVASRFNDFIVNSLVSGAIDALTKLGVSPENVIQVWVPGAIEIPLAAQQLIASHRLNSVLCLGAVIRGATPHFDYVCSAVSSGVMSVGLQTKVPTIFGVLTTNTIEEAIERAGTKAANKGAEAAIAAVEMASLLAKLNTEGTK